MEKADIRYSLLALGIWLSFLLFGYCQESLTRHTFEGKRFIWTQALVVAQSFGNVLVSGLILSLSKSEKSLSDRFTGGVPSFHWFVAGFGYFGAHSFGLASLKHIIYPLQVVIKSCKAIPVLIGEVVLARSRPGVAKIFSVIQLSAGVGLFMYFSDYDHKKGAVSEALWFGVLLAAGALVCDAIYGPYQNLICQRWKPNAWHLMFNMNLYQLVISIVVAFRTRELQEAIAFVALHPSEVGLRLLAFCGSLTLGNIFIYQMQRDFGALAVAKTTTVRKLVSVTLSVLLFGHSMTLSQYLAIGVVFSAPFVEKQIARIFHSKHEPPHVERPVEGGTKLKPSQDEPVVTTRVTRSKSRSQKVQ